MVEWIQSKHVHDNDSLISFLSLTSAENVHTESQRVLSWSHVGPLSKYYSSKPNRAIQDLQDELLWYVRPSNIYIYRYTCLFHAPWGFRFVWTRIGGNSCFRISPMRSLRGEQHWLSMRKPGKWLRCSTVSRERPTWSKLQRVFKKCIAATEKHFPAYWVRI